MNMGKKKVQVDKNDFSLTISRQKIKFDCVFIAIHGTPGEDGRIQGYFDMLRIPYNTCNSIVCLHLPLIKAIATR